MNNQHCQGTDADAHSESKMCHRLSSANGQIATSNDTKKAKRAQTSSRVHHASPSMIAPAMHHAMLGAPAMPSPASSRSTDFEQQQVAVHGVQACTFTAWGEKLLTGLMHVVKHKMALHTKSQMCDALHHISSHMTRTVRCLVYQELPRSESCHGNRCQHLGDHRRWQHRSWVKGSSPSFFFFCAVDPELKKATL